MKSEFQDIYFESTRHLNQQVRRYLYESFYFFTNLIRLVFLLSLIICLFVSTCLGPIGS